MSYREFLSEAFKDRENRIGLYSIVAVGSILSIIHTVYFVLRWYPDNRYLLLSIFPLCILLAAQYLKQFIDDKWFDYVVQLMMAIALVPFSLGLTLLNIIYVVGPFLMISNEFLFYKPEDMEDITYFHRAAIAIVILFIPIIELVDYYSELGLTSIITIYALVTLLLFVCGYIQSLKTPRWTMIKIRAMLFMFLYMYIFFLGNMIAKL